MPWPETGATHYYEQLGLPDKGRAIKGLTVCLLATSERCIVWSLVVARMAIEPKYRNTPQIHMYITYHTPSHRVNPLY